jgi:hypothetical protein
LGDMVIRDKEHDMYLLTLFLQSIATKLLQTSTNFNGQALHPLDSRLEGLNLDIIEALERDGKEFNALEAYTHDTHGATHRHLKPKVQEIFKIKRKGEEEPYEQNGYHQLESGKRRLLWHGSRTTNFGGGLYFQLSCLLMYIYLLSRDFISRASDCTSRSASIRIYVRAQKE